MPEIPSNINHIDTLRAGRLRRKQGSPRAGAVENLQTRLENGSAQDGLPASVLSLSNYRGFGRLRYLPPSDLPSEDKPKG